MRSALATIVLITVWIQGSRASDADSVIDVRSANDTAPKWVEISPSQYFEGNDGPWSSFFVRVGTPEQDVRVLVSTASPETLVVLSDFGCTKTISFTPPSGCASSRGSLFNNNTSSSWHDLGLHGINGDGVGLEANLEYYQAVDYGTDTLTLGLDSNGPSIQNQTFGGIGTAEPFYLRVSPSQSHQIQTVSNWEVCRGIFGLNNQPVNLTTLGNSSSPSFFAALKDKGIIPSLSWSYTAGASYREKQVYGQLIFSGYDISRFTENLVSFTMAADITRDLVVVLQSISYTGSTSMTLLSEPIDIFIDSTDPFLWLPEDVCNQFEKAFGLTLDTASGLYLVNDTQHTALLNSNAMVTFRLSDVMTGGDSVRITFPYNSFDLTAQYPLVSNTSRYFPLKRAANSTQYTLGRTFLQEAYLSADYERGVFNVSACTWNEGAPKNIVPIPPKDSAGSSTASGGTNVADKSSLGGGAIAGIVIGVVLFLALIGLAAVFIIRRRRQKASFAWQASRPEPPESVLNGPVHNSGARSSQPSTQPSIKRPVQQELDGDDPQVYELPGDLRPLGPPAPIRHELTGSDADRTTTDLVSTPSSPPSHGDSREAAEPPSPYISTLGTTGRPDAWWEGNTDLVSPTTPVQRYQ